MKNPSASWFDEADLQWTRLTLSEVFEYVHNMKLWHLALKKVNSRGTCKVLQNEFNTTVY